MKFRAAQWFFLFAVAAILICLNGCASNDPSNASVRPWNTPQSWEGGLPIDMGQHN
jgi:hypothetical protein